MTAKERAKEEGRRVRPLLVRKLDDARRSFARGWWQHATAQYPDLKDHYDTFQKAAGL